MGKHSSTAAPRRTRCPTTSASLRAMTEPQPIESYALLGDMQTVALVSRTGSVDWLCFPRFDSPACFAALLGTPDNGRWRIAPTAENVRASRRYRPGTLILETRFETD